MSPTGAEPPWYDRAFESAYLDLYAHRTDADADREIAWIASLVEFDRDDLVLDLACGHGRHAAAWSRRDVGVIGLDRSSELLARARARKLPNVVFLRGDMRRLPFRGCFKLVTSMFTSFGYFSEPAEDELVVDGVAAALEPGGYFVLDFLNASRIRRELVPRSEERRGPWTIFQERRIDEGRGRVEKRVTMVSDDGERRSHEESVRLYDLGDLVDLFARANLVVAETWGDLAGAPFGPEADRLVILARLETTA